jgi:hypothetical protein
MEFYRMNKSYTYYGALLAAALMFGGIFYFVLGKEADTAQVDGAVITERVAAKAGARVSPTEPPLKVEPK